MEKNELKSVCGLVYAIPGTFCYAVIVVYVVVFQNFIELLVGICYTNLGVAYAMSSKVWIFVGIEPC
ncbi:hypothetical protein Hdeb2414_s0001g00021991 [Helianthus debilis subsp. tardiflorus]